MSDSMTGWGAVRSAIALMRQHIKFFLAFVAFQTVFYFASSAIFPSAEMTELVDVGIAAFFVLAFFIVGMFIAMVYFHYIVTYMRGRPVVFPAKIVRRFFKYVWATIKFMFAIMLLGLVLWLPFGGVMLAAPELMHSDGALVGFGLLSLIALVFVFYAFIRLELVLASAAVDGSASITAAWKLSNGNGWRMFRSFLWAILLFFAMVLVAVAPIFLAPESAQFVMTNIVFGMTNGVSTLLMLNLICVWYAHLTDSKVSFSGQAVGAESKTVSKVRSE